LKRGVGNGKVTVEMKKVAGLVQEGSAMAYPQKGYLSTNPKRLIPERGGFYGRSE